jgi:adenylate cyclase
VRGRSQASERRLAAVWFADIVDYTRLSAEDEDAALALVRDFQAVTREIVDRAGGRVVKFVGDATLAEFPSTHAAATAALGVQHALARQLAERGAEGRSVRVGVHLGEVTGAVDGDLYGDGINVAARIQAEAEPGCVVVSEDVARQLRARRDLALEALGARELKGLPEPIRLFALRDAGEAGLARRETGRPTRAADRSIAVLPFANLSPDPANEYFSDGVTEEILTALAKIDGLKVISRTSVMRYRGTTKPLREIGRELGVATILEGSVRRAGDRVRIAAQLIDARGDAHLWAERYDRDLEDIFAIQTEVAEHIVEALKGRLSPRERAVLAGPAKTNRQAYDAYLKGLWSCARRALPDLRRGRRHFERAIEADPDYAPAWAGLADACVHQLMWGAEEADPDAHDRAHEAAERALDLDPDLGEAHGARALVRMHDADWSGAESGFRRAIELSPGDANTRQWYASFLAGMGRLDEAYAEIDRARELDPVSLPVLTEAGNVRSMGREFAEAVRLYREVVALDPSFQPTRYKLIEVHTAQGRHGDAAEEWARLGEATEDEVRAVREAEQRGDPGPYYAIALRQMDAHRWAHTYRAWILCWIGRNDEALEELEKAVERGDLYLYRLARAVHWDPLRGDPRFRRILERLGLDRIPPPSAAA